MAWITPSNNTIADVTGELNHEDWVRKYRDCFVKYTRKDGSINTGILEDVRVQVENDSSVHYKLVGMNGVKAVHVPHERVELSTPEFGMVEVDGELVYVDRIVQRQWKVILHPQWMKVHNFLRSSPPSKVVVAHHMLTRNPYRPVDASIKMLHTGAVKGVALNRDWGLILSDIYPDIMLVYKQFVVGHTTDQYNFLYNYARVLAPELEDILKEPVVIVPTPEQSVCQRTSGN